MIERTLARARRPADRPRSSRPHHAGRPQPGARGAAAVRPPVDPADRPHARRGAGRDRATLAHTLKGSARGIGAWRVARAAEALELAGGAERGRRRARPLAAASDEARAVIAELLRAN